MIQLIETEPSIRAGKINDAVLGNGQKIELDMAKTIGLKVFHVYDPERWDGREGGFEDRHVDLVVARIKDWYDNGCKDMSEITVIKQKDRED